MKQSIVDHWNRKGKSLTRNIKTIPAYSKDVGGDLHSHHDAQGYVKVSVRVDKRILSALNVPDIFNGRINNSANIGLTREQYVALWNKDHPEDPILL